MIQAKIFSKGSNVIKNNWKWIVIAIVCLLVIYYSKNKISNWFKSNASQESYDIGTGSPSPSNKFRADIYAKEMFEALDGHLFDTINDKEKAAKRIFGLSRNEKIAVWNYWNANYASKMNDETILGSMNSELNIPYISIAAGGTSYFLQLIKYFEEDPKMNYEYLRG